MRRLLLVASLLLPLLAPQSARAAIAFVRGTQPGCTQGTFTLTCAITTSTASNDLIVAIMYNAGSGNVITGITDGGSTYVKGPSIVLTSGVFSVDLWRAHGITSSSSVVITFQNSLAGSSHDVHFLEYSGVVALGTTNTAQNGSTTNPRITTSTQDANNWIVAGCTSNGGPSSTTANTGNLRFGTPLTTASIDNTSASPASVTTSANWDVADNSGCVAMELRSTTGSAAAAPSRTLTGVGQ